MPGLEREVVREVGVGKYCMPRHPTHFEPRFLSIMTSDDVASNISQALIWLASHDVASNTCQILS